MRICLWTYVAMKVVLSILIKSAYLFDGIFIQCFTPVYMYGLLQGVFFKIKTQFQWYEFWKENKIKQKISFINEDVFRSCNVIMGWFDVLYPYRMWPGSNMILTFGFSPEYIFWAPALVVNTPPLSLYSVRIKIMGNNSRQNHRNPHTFVNAEWYRTACLCWGMATH